MTTLSESDVEAAALDWLEGLGWQMVLRPGHRPGRHPDAERSITSAKVVLERRLRETPSPT